MFYIFKKIIINFYIYIFLVLLLILLTCSTAFSSTINGKHNNINFNGPTIEELPDNNKSKIIIKSIPISLDMEFHSLWFDIKNSTPLNNVVKFGHYEQDNIKENGKEDIEWYVLDKDEEKALLVSKYILDCKAFNNTAKNVTWEACTLRSWLNKDFYDIAFNEKEKMIINDTYNENKKNYYYNTDCGKSTLDKVFVLSVDEAIKYFEDDGDYYTKQLNALYPNEKRKAIGTKYAISKGLRASDEKNVGCGNYWLRTLGKNEEREWYNGIFAKYYATIVQEPGYISPKGTAVHSCDDGVRPAMWIKIK